MKLIENWKNENEPYEEGVELLQLLQPQHPLLLTLKAGVSPMNRIYLRNALGSITEAAPAAASTPAKKDDNAPALLRQLRALMAKKNKLRNSFHDCTNDTQRIAVNRKLIALRAEIHLVSRKWDYFKEFGTEPPEPEAPKKKKLKGVDAHRKVLNIRSNISKYKKKIPEAYAAKDQKLIDKWESKLQQFQEQLEYYEQQL